MGKTSVAALVARADAAIVDLDGTMVDTLGDFSEAINRMLTTLSLPGIAAADIKRMVGKGSEHLLRCVLGHVLAALEPAQRVAQIDARYPAAWAAYERHYRAVNGTHAQVFDGVVQGLRALRAADLPLVCVTNKPTAFAIALLQSKGLADFFAHVFGGDAFERKKPDPLPLLKACEALGTAPARTLAIGDSVNDARAARAAGCPVVLVTYGYNHGQPVRSIEADAYVDSLRELRAAA